MKAARIAAGSVAAGLAAALLAGAFWAQHADIDPDRYIINGDVITAVGALLGALCLALAGQLFYRSVRSR
jgi:hypothetical protein